MIATLLALAVFTTPAHAEEDAPWEPEAVEDAAEPKEAAEPEVEIFDEAPVEEEVEEAPVAPTPGIGEDVLGLGYRDGYQQGKDDAGLAGDYGLHGLLGFAGGCVVGPCGCVAVPALEAVVSPGVPPGGWQAYSPEYQRGYIDGYRREVQKRRVVVSLAGASLGTVVGVGAGMAVGALAF